jgi:hypothetical protein
MNRKGEVVASSRRSEFPVGANWCPAPLPVLDSRPDLGERWPSGPVATAAEERLIAHAYDSRLNFQLKILRLSRE